MAITFYASLLLGDASVPFSAPPGGSFADTRGLGLLVLMLLPVPFFCLLW
jgi:hypothetical protein